MPTKYAKEEKTIKGILDPSLYLTDEKVEAQRKMTFSGSGNM